MIEEQVGEFYDLFLCIFSSRRKQVNRKVMERYSLHVTAPSFIHRRVTRVAVELQINNVERKMSSARGSSLLNRVYGF